MSKQSFDSSEFVVSAPDLQVGLSSEIEGGTKPKDFLNRYHAEYDIKCAFCKTHTIHRRGFTVLLEDGRKALCGIFCARDFFGDEVVNRFAWDLESQIKQQKQRRILAKTVEGAPSALTILNEGWIEVEKTYHAAVCAVRNWIEVDDVRKALFGDKLLLKRARSQFVPSVGKDGRETQKKVMTEEVQAQINGASCLLTSGPPLAFAKGGIAVLVERAKKPDAIKGKVASDLMEKRRKIKKSIDDGVQFVQLAHVFFQEENLGHFISWCRRKYSGDAPDITLDKDGRLFISHPDHRGVPTVVYLPQVLSNPAPLKQLLAARV